MKIDETVTGSLEVAFSRDGSPGNAHWCVLFDGVGSVPLAWFHDRASAKEYLGFLVEKYGRRPE